MDYSLYAMATEIQRLQDLLASERAAHWKMTATLLKLADYLEDLFRSERLIRLNKGTWTHSVWEWRQFKNKFDAETERLLNDCNDEEVRAPLDTPPVPVTFTIKDGKRCKALQDIVDRYFVPGLGSI